LFEIGIDLSDLEREMAKWNENADPENFEDLVDFTDYLHESYGQ